MINHLARLKELRNKPNKEPAEKKDFEDFWHYKERSSFYDFTTVDTYISDSDKPSVEKTEFVKAPTEAVPKVPKVPDAMISCTTSNFGKALDEVKNYKLYGASRNRHGQAILCAEMFIREWAAIAASLGWSDADVVALSWWLGVRLVRAVGPEHAVAEDGDVFDRTTRKSLKSPLQANRPEAQKSSKSLIKCRDCGRGRSHPSLCRLAASPAFDRRASGAFSLVGGQFTAACM
jgi:hypothetical protein